MPQKLTLAPIGVSPKKSPNQQEIPGLKLSPANNMPIPAGRCSSKKHPIHRYFPLPPKGRLLRLGRVCFSFYQICLFCLFFLFFLFSCVSPLIKAPSVCGAESAPSSESTFREQVRQWIQHLDAENYFLRQQAQQQLEQMLAQPETAPLTAEEIRRCLADKAISLEVRHGLDSLQRRFPGAFPPAPSGTDSSPPPIALPTSKQIEALVRQLESDSYAERRGAAEQLKTYLDNPESAGQMLAVFRTRLARGDISADLRRWIDPLWERAWGAWLASSSPSTELSPAQPEEIQRYVDIVARPVPAGSPQALGSLRQAQRQLRMLLARDDQVPLIREAVQRRLDADQLPSEVQARLTELADLCRPAMVAEFWQQRQHRGIQHLLVGVPSQVAGAPRPSHFDYIDDTTAHCVSGSNLTPGHYPVGVAVPHPHQADAFFHLVNLPTPRRRMAYDYLVQRDVRVRLAEITQRTCQYYSGRRQPLSEREILVLAQLEPKQWSRFASEFLRNMADQPLGQEEGQTAAGQTSRNGLLCMILADQGLKEAAPGLLEALSQGRILPPTPEAPYAWGWIAALAIAARDPWPEVDDWLAGVAARTDLLRLPGATPGPTKHPLDDDPFGFPPPPAPPPRLKISPPKANTETPSSSFEDQPPQLGATAAALLLQRHQQTPTAHGLQPAPDPMLEKCKVQGYRFADPKTPEQILQWWKTRRLLRTSAG